MKTVFFTLCSAAVLTLSATVPDNSWSIVLSGKGSTAEKHFDQIAARLLKKGVKHLTGADLKIVTGTKKTKNAIFVGRHADPVKFENNFWQGRFRTDNEGNWYFAGSSRALFNREKHLNHRFHEAGIIRCAALFLREYAGFRSVLPDWKYQYFTKKRSVDFPKNFVINYKAPDILYCNGRNTNDPVYDLANGYLPGVWYHTYGGHSHPVAVPTTLFDRHPEYFFLTKKGKRWKGVQYCISNPGFQELVYKEMCRKADLGYQWVQLSQTDGFSLCNCKNCQDFCNTRDAGEKIWILHRKLAERFHKERPGKKVVILCYDPNRNPPKTFKAFPPNVIIETSRYTEEAFKQWQDTNVPGGFVTYVYNWGVYHPEGYSPKLTPDQVVEQLKTFRKYNVKGIYRCGFGELSGLEGAAYYTYGAALTDPAVTADKAVMEFCRGVMPQSPQTLKKFYDKLHAVMAKGREHRYINWQQIFSKRMPGGYKNHYLYAARYDERSLAELDALLKECEKILPGDDFPRLLRREFDLIRHAAGMSRAYLKYLKNPDAVNLQQLEKAVKQRSAYIESLPRHKTGRFSFVANQPLFAQGNPKTLIPGGTGPGRFVYPVSWPWQQLMQLKIVPGSRSAKVDGQAHILLPALMEKWELDIKFKMDLTKEGVRFTFTGPVPVKNSSDIFYINLPEYRINFRCGNGVGNIRTASVYLRKSDKKSVTGETFFYLKDERTLKVKRLDQQNCTILIPWRFFPGKTRPAAGTKLPFNVSFRRQTGHLFQMLTFEPDLKYLDEKNTWMSGRGTLAF